jgi:hypothetical protein
MLWRSTESVQLELGERAVVVDGPLAAAVRRLARPSRGAGAGPPLPEPALRSLTEAGFLWQLPAPVPAVGEPGADQPGTHLSAADPSGAHLPGAHELGVDRLAPPEPRLAGEFTALAARRGARAAEVLAARRYSAVEVRGSGRTGPLVAAHLAASGVGRVRLAEQRAVRAQHSAPGGVLPSDEGRALELATADAVRRAAPGTATGPLPPHERADLVILACDEPIDPDHRERLHRSGVVHLVVQLSPGGGVVGPLVIPGLTSCLHCADLHRLDRDPAWTALAVQLSVPRRHARTADVALTGVIAGLATQQALAFLDGDEPATVDGTLEQHPPDWRVRRRSWPVHPDCDCTGERPDAPPPATAPAG